MITGVVGHKCLRPCSSADVGVPILAQSEKRAGWCRVQIRTKQPNNGSVGCAYSREAQDLNSVRSASAEL